MNGRLGGEKKAARAFRCYIKLGGCLTQSESVGGRVALAESELCRRHHEGDRAPAGRAMRKPDRGQGAGRGRRGRRWEGWGHARPGPAAPDAILSGSSGR